VERSRIRFRPFLHYWNFSADVGAQRIVETLVVAAKDTERAGFAEFI
jgi:hypothetical protein